MKTLLRCFCILFPVILSSQNLPKCGHEIYIDYRQKHNANYIRSVNEAFDNAKSWSYATPNSISKDSLLRLPVVVHVLYENDMENISEESIKSQIDVLNEDYKRLNADKVETRAQFDTLAGRSNFEFYLATTDPDGNLTSGITRTSTNVSSFMSQNFQMDLMKSPSSGGVFGWPNDKYINIWVCDIAINGQVQLLGYATPPNSLSEWEEDMSTSAENDGIVIHYELFGRNSVVNFGYDVAFLGRVTTHEVGHYLGLRHIWGDGLCEDDDGIHDTPFANSSSQNICNHNKNTCLDFPYDYNDMIENYMDYSNPSCQNIFTKGQMDLMHGVLSNQRAELPRRTVNVNTNKLLLLDVYPNPSNDILHIKLGVIKSQHKLQLIDVSGKVIWEIQLNQKDNRSIKLSTHNFARGIYFLKLQSDSYMNRIKKVFLH